MVTGTTRSRGSISQFTATCATTGTITTVKAKLLMTSVKNNDKTTNPPISRDGLMLGTVDTESAIAPRTLASASCLASVSPPPKSSKMSHGSRLVSSQVRSVCLRCKPPAGRTKRSKPATMAMDVSFKGIPHCATMNRRPIHNMAVATKTTATRFSAAVHAPKPSSSSFSPSTPADRDVLPNGHSTRVSNKYTTASNRAEKGKAIILHSKKDTDLELCSSSRPAMATFGGVPTRVAIPPTFAA